MQKIQEEQPWPSHSSHSIHWSDLTEEQENLNYFEGSDEVPDSIDEFVGSNSLHFRN